MWPQSLRHTLGTLSHPQGCTIVLISVGDISAGLLGWEKLAKLDLKGLAGI